MPDTSATDGARAPATGAAPKCPFSKLFGSKPTQNLSAELKEKTAQAHHRAEFHPLQQRIVRGELDPTEYAPFARALEGIHRSLEAALDAAAAGEPRISGVFHERHRRAAHFPADFAALGLGASPSCGRPSPALAKAQQWIEQSVRTEPLRLIGVLYVLEGSTNGGMVIARVLRKAWGDRTDLQLRSVDPHGERTREFWQEFRQSIDKLDLTAAQRDSIVAAASWTFDAITEVMDETSPRACSCCCH